MNRIAHKNLLFRQLLLATTLATGFGTLWFALALWFGTSIQGAWPGRNRPPQESFVVKTDGTPLIESIPRENRSLVTYRDLRGRVFDAMDSRERLSAVYLSGVQETSGRFSSRIDWEDKVKLFMDDREPTVNWYFIHNGLQQGAGYFVAYEQVSNRRIGFIGLSGFRSHSLPTEEWIPVRGELVMGYSLWSSIPFSVQSGRAWVVRPDRWDLPPRLVYVPSGNRLRLVDLAARTIATVFEAPDPIVAVGIPTLSSLSDGHLTRERPVLVRTREKIHALDHKHNVVSVFTIPAELDRRSAVSWYDIGNGRAIAEFLPPQSIEDAEVENVTKRVVYRVAGDGTIEETFAFSLQTGSHVTKRQEQDVLLALGLPAPAILLTIEPFFAMTTDRGRTYSTAFIAELKRSWPSLAAVLALSAVLAMLAWRRSHAFGLSRREQLSWAVFVLLLGFPGFVGFLLAPRWPAREPCPNCQTQVAVDRAACAECGNRFPEPPRKGIEIFA